ncbi:MAG TPA: S8 family serine peptidase [Bryobacteraceae bacterium]|jgi:subtilisin family serine protease
MRSLKPFLLTGLLLLQAVWATPARADSRYVVRVNGGLPILRIVCGLLGCNVARNLDGSVGRVFLITTASGAPPATFLSTLLRQIGVVDAEPDLLGSIADSGYTVPPALSDSTPVDYFGTTVPEGYVNQPANQITRAGDAQRAFGVKGVGTVAVIDTGIDPNHPALQHVLVPGYDFTRNRNGEGDETGDILLTSTPTASAQSFWVGSNTSALVTQSTAAVVDGNPQYSDFGHGTMVAGVIHLVAPGALLMPLKAFRADGTGYTSDIVRAIYWAVQNHANIINMSFTLAAYSQEVKNAVDYASLAGVICVAAAGNQSKDMLVYPAALNNVISVASTTNNDQLSSFSNYGQDLVWLGAPGEGIVTTYPFGTYAAAWGTSFSAPFVSGGAALMLDYGGSLLMDLLIFENQSDGAKAVAHAKPLGPALGHGRLDIYQALTAWRQIMGVGLL